MSVLEDLAELGIVNVYQLGSLWHAVHPDSGLPPAIAYRSGGAGASAAWQVYRGMIRTDPDPGAPTLDYGRKTFGIDGPVRTGKPKALQEAKDWASARYGVWAWAKHPGGQQLGEAWYPRDVVAWLNTELAKVRTGRAAEV